VSRLAFIEAQREAFVQGVKVHALGMGNWTKRAEEAARVAAKGQFPMTETRPRIVRVTLTGRTFEFKVVDGVQYRRQLSSGDGSIAKYVRTMWTPTSWTLNDLRCLVSIFEQPTETVSLG
jgi:hypothetical protein